ncbi:hypothetical protein NCAS_0C01200 [Naumovozyma castellii]|uniref:Uncharacterized protein n=1 Tax=Naumovozyma castellii TaxID=27288 RepID=G0VCA1_NAUCA|nr:hypothetical protein NCAS_0C01200 [Naumovozyma castellii CBS 4309]CCC69110.1 hypothetical protein NCAS_0C01200 [Naumovozyma castellii CBS 4309]
MRAQPPPRKSNWSLIVNTVIKIRRFYSCHRLRKRWNIHQIHRVQYKRFIARSPTLEFRSEDMFNIPTNMIPKDTKKKPLMIASFPEGCSNSPQLNVLQRNEKSRLFLSRRRYKLKNIDNKNFKPVPRIGSDSMNPLYPCAETVRSIKQLTNRHADVRVVFHNSNVIKSTRLRKEQEDGVTPQLIQFDNERTIRLDDYPALSRRNGKRDGNNSELAKVSQNDKPGPPIYKNTRHFIKITYFKNSDIISHSSFLDSTLRTW